MKYHYLASVLQTVHVTFASLPSRRDFVVERVVVSDLGDSSLLYRTQRGANKKAILLLLRSVDRYELCRQAHLKKRTAGRYIQIGITRRKTPAEPSPIGPAPTSNKRTKAALDEVIGQLELRRNDLCRIFDVGSN